MEEILIICRYKLTLLFDTKRFKLREETIHKNGVDMVIEPMQNGIYTDTSFLIHLTLTSSTERSEPQNITYQIEVAEIKRLLEFEIPIYYILYDHSHNRFYIENVQTLYQLLIQKYKFKKFPEKFDVIFSHVLDIKSTQDIHDTTIQNVKLRRRLIPSTKLSLSSVLPDLNKVLYSNFEIYSVKEALDYIESYGFQLLNEEKFKQIIEIEHRTSPRTHATVKFNFVCGVAYYYTGELIKSINFLTQAQKQTEATPFENRGILNYILVHAKLLNEGIRQKSRIL